MKAKEQVRLRSRKLKNGGASLYLDIYSKGVRKYDYLGLYLREERTPHDRALNGETMRVAEAIRARRMIEFQRTAGEFPVVSDRTVENILGDWIDTRKGRTKGTVKLWGYWIEKVRAFPLIEYSLRDLSPDWWRRYKAWVGDQGLSPVTQRHYIARMRCVLNKAVKDGLLLKSPSEGDRIPSLPKTERVWLTVEELRALKNNRLSRSDLPVPKHADIYERAFLFGCMTGLRYSDIRALRWEDVQGTRIVKKIVKTHKIEYMDLNFQALDFMGERDSGLVFPKLNSNTQKINAHLVEWAKFANVNKHLSFHASRHTFAVQMLSAGVDIYTLSKLLGHSSVQTTQIYADIIDARRKEAVNKMPIL